MILNRPTLGLLLLLAAFPFHSQAQQVRLDLDPAMLINEQNVGDPRALLDEQREIIGPPAGAPQTTWKLNPGDWNRFPASVHLDLGSVKNLASLWIFDTHDKGDLILSVGEPGQWRQVATFDCATYMAWAEIKLNVSSRYLRLTRQTPGANFSEIALYEHTEDSWKSLLQRRAEEEQREAARQAALRQAREDALQRPLVQLEPYGTLSLVDEIDCAADPGDRPFEQHPADASGIETILGQPARVLPPTKDEAAFFSYRIGQMKLLRPGGVYVLAIDYPEDAPRSMIVVNTGNETSRGFHTGPTIGDALHPKYVNNLPESINVPLSGRWETWSLLLHLHDRFTEQGLVRGPEPRKLTPEDGFTVTIAQFSAGNMPLSRGAAVSRIRLLEVIDPDLLAQPLSLPPAPLPRRHLFWREEMADGVIDRKASPPGISEPLDWYRFKAELMRFLGMNTYSKDLLEFGACQHWDPTPLGGNDWVFHDNATKHLWGEIVQLMGQRGLNVLPYYEYSGSKGYKGLGNQRRARPLTRDDAYTHINWIESANADLTDPDTRLDFQKMLDLTVLRLRDKASFPGVWIRPRGQLPVSFSDQALARFRAAVDLDKPVTRAQLRDDTALYDRYLAWWRSQRRTFLTALRDHLHHGGIDQPFVLFTGCAGEPGVPFATWDPHLVTDQPELWAPLLSQPGHAIDGRKSMTPWSLQEVGQRNLYLEALLAPALNWGDWEVHHSQPADDPQNYKSTKGLLFSHAFNRNYTVISPQTFETYRSPAGLAVIRHYALNEHMIYDRQDKEVLGYFIADMERAGPYCMMAEALAMAHGDPTMIGYLAGGNWGRGFPKYVREFNAHFLALPALPSTVIPKAANDPSVVVRRIVTEQHGTWFALINTDFHPKTGVTVSLPENPVRDAVTGEPLPLSNGKLSLDLFPFQLRSLHLPPPNPIP